jgi:protein-tyrosine phosphatase
MEPALLAGMAYPAMGMPWHQLFYAGISNVVCLCSERIEYNPAPLRVLHAVAMEDLHHGTEPKFPTRDERLVREAVEIISERLAKGEGVAVHCIGGTGRTGTVIGCLLRSMGYPADETIRYLDDLNRSRGKRGWPEAPWQAEMIRRFQ